MSAQRISVAVRIRPPIERERYAPLCARKANDDQTIIIKPEENAANMGEPVPFQFDVVFDETDDQRAVYEESVQEMVDHALSGYSVTVFTYGQTGSGKTFTILGNIGSSGIVSEQSGIFLRVFDDIFHYREAASKRVHIVIALSALELYVEDVTDLLANKKKLKLREAPEETLILGISSVEVKSMPDVVQSFQIANSFRAVATTKMNDASSRSHALFFVDLFQIPLDGATAGTTAPPLSSLLDDNGVLLPNAAPGLVRSRIALVDLAGSERVKRSGVQGQAMVEAQAINKSLSTLGTVINAMYVQSSHIPFRESKLTKLLKPSFVDTSSRLLLIGQVAPPTNSAAESLGTLRFCDRVKGLKAGQVTGFCNPEEEESFLASLQANDAITAEMRILGVETYYTPVNLRVLSAIKGVTLDVARQQRIQELQAGRADLLARKEQEILTKAEQAAAANRDAEVEAFVHQMNSMIEEYEQVAQAAKKTKKTLKKMNEELQADEEARVYEAKKAKKHRVKAEEALATIKAELEQELENEHAVDASADGVDDADTKSVEEERSTVTPAMEESNHRLVEAFHAECLEMNYLYSTYVARLAATGRQRALVRRQKLMNSSLVTEGTLLYDILTFIVNRAVDIAEGITTPTSRWKWQELDGISRQLLSAEQFYPPLLEGKGCTLTSAAMPCDEQPHTITFLSSDESDGENSHHNAETRRRRTHGETQNDPNNVFSPSDCEEKGSSVDDSDDDQGPPPVLRESDWLAGPLESGVSETIVATEVPKKKKRSRRVEEEDSGERVRGEQTAAEAGPTAEGETGHTAETAVGEDGQERRRKRKKKKKHHEDGEEGPAEAEEVPVPVAPSKNLSKEELDQRYVMQVYDSPTLVQDLIKFLRSGTVMLKHGRNGKPHRRLFWVSITKGRKELVWMEPDSRRPDRSAISLDSVSYIQLGSFSKVFKRYPIQPHDPCFFRCFTIGLKKGGRTVDVVADCVPDYEAWVVGLSHLVGVDPDWGGKLDVTKEPGYSRLSYFESGLCEANYLYPVHYLALKREVQLTAKRTLETLESCGNDQQKAYEILGGIHPPAVNEKGAVYLTKGELRFLCPDLKLDIFRITRVWMLFQQLYLVYDDKFIPATPFGVTHRE